MDVIKLQQMDLEHLARTSRNKRIAIASEARILSSQRFQTDVDPMKAALFLFGSALSTCRIRKGSVRQSTHRTIGYQEPTPTPWDSLQRGSGRQPHSRRMAYTEELCAKGGFCGEELASIKQQLRASGKAVVMRLRRQYFSPSAEVGNLLCIRRRI